MEVVKIPDKILFQKTKPANAQEVKNGSLKNLILGMKENMKSNNGVGLAANQIGKNMSVFIIDEKLAQENNISDVFINPEITEYSKEKNILEEGCLSIPEYYTGIKRSKKIKIKFIDGNGKKVKTKAKGFLARVLQHETDHLNGLTIKERE